MWFGKQITLDNSFFLSRNINFHNQIANLQFSDVVYLATDPAFEFVFALTQIQIKREQYLLFSFQQLVFVALLYKCYPEISLKSHSESICMTLYGWQFCFALILYAIRWQKPFYSFLETIIFRYCEYRGRTVNCLLI